MISLQYPTKYPFKAKELIRIPTVQFKVNSSIKSAQMNQRVNNQHEFSCAWLLFWLKQTEKRRPELLIFQAKALRLNIKLSANLSYLQLGGGSRAISASSR